jgi:hypothetical protein
MRAAILPCSTKGTRASPSRGRRLRRPEGPGLKRAWLFMKASQSLYTLYVEDKRRSHHPRRWRPARVVVVGGRSIEAAPVQSIELPLPCGSSALEAIPCFSHRQMGREREESATSFRRSSAG